MKRELFRCDYCNIEKFNSETQEYINVAFQCSTLAHWKQHLSRPKHFINITKNKSLKEDLVVECKLCKGVFTKSQYEKHKERNLILFFSKDPIYKDCSCNHFVVGKKRFETLKELADYQEVKQKYSYGKDKQINYNKLHYDKAIEILHERELHENEMIEARKRNEEKMKKQVEDRKAKQAKQATAQKAKKKEVIKEKVIDNIELTIEDEYNKLNGIEDKVDPKTDLNEPPDFCDFCEDCGKPDNTLHEYSSYKLEKYEIDICDCESDED